MKLSEKPSAGPGNHSKDGFSRTGAQLSEFAFDKYKAEGDYLENIRGNVR